MLVLSAPRSSDAYENEVQIFLSPGSGTYDYSGVGDADTAKLVFGTAYTRYFNNVVTDDSPYGVRQFLQHPSWAGILLSSLAYKMEDNYSTFETEEETDSIGLGGRFYTPSVEHSTGFGLMYLMREGDVEYRDAGGLIGKDDITLDTLFLTVEQYLAKSAMLSLEYSKTDYESKDEFGSVSRHDENMMSFMISSLIDNMLWVQAGLNTGKIDYDYGADDDIDGIKLEVGVYPAQQVGIFLSYENEKADDGTGYEKDSTDISLRGNVYFTETMYLDAKLTKGTVDYKPSNSEIDERELTLTYGLMF